MDCKSDSYLISRFLVYKDQKAFKHLIDRYEGDLKRFLLKLNYYDKEVVNDLTQETFIKMYKYLKSYRGISNFKTWLFKIAYNVFLEKNKKEKRHKDMISQWRPTENTNPINSLDAKMDVQMLLMSLRPEEKVAIELSYLHGLSHRDIATVLECPLGTVKSYIMRGKSKIMSKIKINET